MQRTKRRQEGKIPHLNNQIWISVSFVGDDTKH